MDFQSQEPLSVDALAEPSGYSSQEPQLEVALVHLSEFYSEIVRELM